MEIFVIKRKKKTALVQSWLSACAKEMEVWCQGKMWMPRAGLLLLFAYISWQHVINPESPDLFKGLNLGIHEMGHMIFAPCGEFIAILGGSLFQCLVPIGSMFMFLRQRDYFAIAFAWGWLSTNLSDVAVYASDARAMDLPLVSPGAQGGEIIHDWNYLLDKLGWLPYDHVIGQIINLDAMVSMLICLGFGAWLCFTMQQSRPLPEAELPS